MQSTNILYVVGHKNPDADAIASAVGYAWLLRERDGEEAEATRAGPINPQTDWALKKLGLKAPHLLTDASPQFESVTRRLDSTTPDRPLREAWAITSRTDGVAPVINEDGTPYGIISGWSLFHFFTRAIGNPGSDQAGKTIGQILDVPCREACDTDVAHFRKNDRIKSAINQLLRDERSDFWIVVDEQGHYVGICRQRDLLNPPRLRLVLVDHNEAAQSVESLEEADLIEVIDHHRLGNPSTRIPIRFSVDVVGSTSTIISERIEVAGLSAPPPIAGLLLAGLVSDTLMLRSPTSTARDEMAVKRLSRWAFTANSPLAGEDYESFAQDLLKAGAGLSARSPQEIVQNDLKFYAAGEKRFAIAQAEVTDLVQLAEHRQALTEALEGIRQREGLAFAILMVTDIVRGSSRLLTAGETEMLKSLPYPMQEDGIRQARGVVSRKKQLLPLVLGLVEGDA
jgi:manganese-dependent inorganic pyrophosphatase